MRKKRNSVIKHSLTPSRNHISRVGSIKETSQPQPSSLHSHAHREKHDLDFSSDASSPCGGGAAGRCRCRHPRGGADAGDSDVRGEARDVRRLHELDQPAGHVLQPDQAGGENRPSLPLQPLQHPRPARLLWDQRHPGSPAYEGVRRLHQHRPLQRDCYASIVINNTTSDARGQQRHQQNSLEWVLELILCPSIGDVLLRCPWFTLDTSDWKGDTSHGLLWLSER